MVTAGTVGPPTSLRVVSVVGNTVTLSFKAPSDSVTPTGYVVEGGTTPGQVLGSLPIAAGATTVTFPAPTGTFYVRAHALAVGLRSAASNEVRLFVNVAAKPAAPTNLLYLVDGNTVSLAWMNSASGGALTGVGPIVQGAVNTFLPMAVTENLTGPNVPAGTYYLWVHGFNRSGDGPNSNGVVVRVPGSCTGIPGTPLNLNATRSGNAVSIF